MATAIQHRGPDGEGYWVDTQHGVGLGHRRLSIVDLSPQGAQPMRSSSSRYIAVFNGEIYNFRTLRQQLEGLGHRFNGSSDTEVMLASIEQWGVEAAVPKFVGMFAIALWDTREELLHLVRDRLGKKPLYIAQIDGGVLFGSEIKALAAHAAFQREVDPASVARMLQVGYVPGPGSVFRGVRKVPPGAVVTFRKDVAGELTCRDSRYWSLGDYTPAPGPVDAEAAVDALDDLLRDAVRMRMISDVPLGAFLSGGIDSSLVVALMQQTSVVPVRTFSIGFRDPALDEAPYARAIADHLGTDHTEFYVDEPDAMAVVPLLADIYDEPFADSSQIPTYLVSRLARQHVTVALSGDGGDEFFGGYQRYFRCSQLWSILSRVPLAARRPMANLLRLVPAGGRVRQQRDRLVQLAGRTTQDSFYAWFMSQWPEPGSLVRGMEQEPGIFPEEDRRRSLPEFFDRMMRIDAQAYLPDDILVKVDRASMRVSLEARAPLLDHRVVEFAAALPHELKVEGRMGKRVLRRLLGRYLPTHLWQRPKAGFGVPLDSWLRGGLRDWAEDLLSERSIESSGLLRTDVVRSTWARHLARHEDHGARLWNVLMFQAWHRRWIQGGGGNGSA
jgi:asparagine synthase (glutamine-hydrolysing)